MAQNFMCDTVTLDAPHSDEWEETESPVDEFLLAGGFSKGEGSSARTGRSPPQSPPRLQPNAHQLPDHHNHNLTSSATTYSPGANRASYFARQYLVSAEDLIRPPSSPTRIPSTGNRVSPASPSSSSTSTAAGARRVVRATSSSNREINDESTFYPPTGRPGGGIIGDFSPVRVPVGSAEDSVEDDPRGQVPQPTRSPPPIDFQLEQHPGADALSTREVDHFSDVEPIQPGLQGVGEGAEDVEPRSGSSPGLYYEDPPPLRRYRGHRSDRTSFVDDYRQHSLTAEGAAGAAVSVDSLFLDLENPKTLSLASPEREIANAIDRPETADGVQDEDQEDPDVLDNRSPLVENKTSDDLDHDLRSSTSSSTLLPTAAATSSALPATINSATFATAAPLMSGESALAQAAVLATQTMQHHLNMSLKYVALLYHNLEVNQKIRSDSKEKDHLRGGSGSTSTSSACSSSRSSLQFQVHGHEEDEEGETSSGTGDSSAAPRAPVSFPQRSAFSYNSTGKKSPDQGEDAPEQAARAAELDLTSDGNYLTAVMLNSSLLKAMHVVETFQQHAVQVYSESNAVSAGGGLGDDDDEEDGGAGDKREMGKPGVDLLSQVDDYVSFDGTLTTIYEGEDPESARVAYRNASKGLHTSDSREQPNNVAAAGAATADEQSRARDHESLPGAPDGGTTSSVVPSIFSLPQARKTLEKQDARTFRERITTCESLHDVIQSLTQQHLQWKEEVLLLEQKKAELEQKVRKLEDEAEGESEEEHMVRVIKVVEDLTDAVEVQKSATAEAERSAAEARTHRVHLETMVAKISAALGEGRDLVTDLAAVSPDDGVRKLVTSLRLQRKKVKSMQESFGALQNPEKTKNATNGARSKDTSATSEAGGGAAAATLSEAETTTTATASATPAPVLTTGGLTKIDVASLEKLRVQELEQRYELLSRKYTELLKKKGASSATGSAATTEQRGSAGGPGPVILNTNCFPSRSSAGAATGNGSLLGGGSGYTNSQDSTPVANLKQQEPVVFDPQPRTPDITFTTGGGSGRGGGRRGVVASSRASAGLTMARERGAGSAPRAARTAPILLQQHAALTGSSASSSSSKPPTAPGTTTAAGAVVPAAFGGGKKKEKPTSELDLEEIKALLAKTTKKPDAQRTNKNPRLSAPARGPAQKSSSRGITPQRNKAKPASDRTQPDEDPDIVEILDGDDESVEDVGGGTEYKTSGPQHNKPSRSSPTAPRRKSPEQAELASASCSGTASLVEVEVAAAPRPPEKEASRVDTTTDTEELLPDSASASESIVVLEEQAPDRGGPGGHQRHQAKIKHARAIGSLPMRTFGSGGGAETANANPAFTISTSSSHPPSMGAPANKLFSRGEQRATTTSSSAAATSSAASLEQQRSRARNRSPLMSRLTSDMTSEEIADMARAAAKDPATFLACFRNRSPIPSKTSTTTSGGGNTNTSTTSTTTYRCRSPDAGGTGPKARGRKAAFR